MHGTIQIRFDLESVKRFVR